MSHITGMQLQVLTERVHDRLAEFEHAIDLPSLGIVRTIVDELFDWQAEGPVDSDALDGGYGPAVYPPGWKADPPANGFALATKERDEWAAGYAKGLERGLAHPSNGFALATDSDGRTVEQTPWQVIGIGDDPRAYTGFASGAQTVTGITTNSTDDDPSDLAADWPDMPDLEGGIDRFAEYPIAGEPESVVAERPIGRDRLPHPDVARERLAQALAKGSGGNLVQAINMPRTLAEVDDDEDGDEVDDDEDGDEVEERQFKTSPEERRRAKEYRQRTHHTRRARHNENGEAKGHSGKILPSREQVIAELQRQAMAGVMPTRAQFDIARPANWATAQAHVARLGMSWGELCDAAGLKPNPRLAAAMEA